MNEFKWKVYNGTRHIDSGTIQAESERDAMGQVLLAQDGKLKAEESYSFTVGDMKMSTYGDECRRSAEVSGYGRDAEQEPLKGGHLFPAPGLDKELMDRIVKTLAKGVITKARDKLVGAAAKAGSSFNDLRRVSEHICQKFMDGRHHDMNGTVENHSTGENHAQCLHCGFIDLMGLGTYADGSVLGRPVYGTDQIVGVALNGAEKGQTVDVWLNAGYQVTNRAGAKVYTNDPLRMGVDGRVYPSASDICHGPYNGGDDHHWFSTIGELGQECAHCGQQRSEIK